MTYKNKTITKHKRGNWWVRVRYNGKYISIYGRTKAETYEKLKVIADKIEEEKALRLLEKFTMPEIALKPIAESNPTTTVKTYTFEEWFNEWLSSYKIGNVRATTVDGFKKCFRKLKKLYDAPLTEITNLMLSKAINEVTANRTKDGVHNMLKQIFTTAFNNRLIETNPAANLPRPKQFAKTERKAFTLEQEKKFIDLCKQNLELYEPLLICVLQGLRKGEMLALRPNDFDFEKNTLRIDESFDELHPDDLQTKNQDSNRVMPMFDLTKQVLLKYRDYCPTERIYKDSTTALWKKLEQLLKENNLPRLTVHELRHTFISRCHEKGIDEIIVQKWVGHAVGSRMTKAVYTHIADDAEKRYIELLNAK